MTPTMYEYSFWLKMDEAEGLDRVENALKFSGHTVLGTVTHAFEPQGYTSLWLLAESHLAIHTYPEHGALYVQLSSCSKEKHDLFKQAIVNGWPNPLQANNSVSDLFSTEN